MGDEANDDIEKLIDEEKNKALDSSRRLEELREKQRVQRVLATQLQSMQEIEIVSSLIRNCGLTSPPFLVQRAEGESYYINGLLNTYEVPTDTAERWINSGVVREDAEIKHPSYKRAFSFERWAIKRFSANVDIPIIPGII